MADGKSRTVPIFIFNRSLGAGVKDLKGVFMFKRLFSVMVALAGLALMGLLAFPTMALAAEATATFGDVVQQLLYQVVFPVFGAGLMALGAWVMKGLGEKFKTDIFINNEKIITDSLRAAIGYGQEFVASQAKKRIHTSGSEALDMAIIKVRTVIPTIDREDARKRIEAILGKAPLLKASAIPRPPKPSEEVIGSGRVVESHGEALGTG